MDKKELTQISEDIKNDEHFVVDDNILTTDVQDHLYESDDRESFVVYKDIQGSTLRENDNSKIFAIEDEFTIDKRVSEGEFNKKLGSADKDYIVESKGEEIKVKVIGEEYDKETEIIPDEQIDQYDRFVDGSYPDEELDDVRNYLDDENVAYASEFEKLDQNIKMKKMQEEDADPRTLNDNKYGVVHDDEQAIVMELGQDDRMRVQKDTISIPGEDGRKAVINTSKGRRTRLDGAPIKSIDIDELMKKTGSDSVSEAIHKFETADKETLDETFGEGWDDEKPDSYKLWADMMEEDTEINDYRRLPSIIKLSEMYNVDSSMDMDDIHDVKMSREEVFMSLSTHYVDDFETAEKLFEELDEQDTLEAEDIVEYLPDKINNDDKEHVARQLLVNIKEIDNAFNKHDGVVEQNGTVKMPMLDSSILGTGYSVYPYIIVQTKNGETYTNGVYYQASYREGGVSKSDYIATGGSFGYDKVPSNT